MSTSSATAIKFAWAILLKLIFAFTALVHATDTNTLVINNTNEAPFTNKEGNGNIDAIATEAFRRAGLQIELVKLPAERGLLNANAGIDDGDLTRIRGIDKIYTNLIMVPEKLMDWEFVAFSKNKNEIANWNAIRKKSVGHITGWKIYEHKLKGAHSVVNVRNANQLFSLLAQGRIDIALYARWMGQAKIKEMGLAGIYQLNPVLDRKEMFIYLNHRHQDKVPLISAALKDLKQEGFYEFHEKRVLLPLQQE